MINGAFCVVNPLHFIEVELKVVEFNWNSSFSKVYGCQESEGKEKKVRVGLFSSSDLLFGVVISSIMQSSHQS